MTWRYLHNNRNSFGLILIIGVVFMIWGGCNKKDDTPLVPVNPSNTDTTEPCIDSSFIFGKESDIIQITTFSEVISISGPFHGGEDYLFDVDQDGKDDFRFASFHNISPGGIDAMAAVLHTLDSNFQVAVVEYADSIFLCDTTFSGITFSNYYNSFTYTGCDGGPENSFQYVYMKYYPAIFSQGDTLQTEAYWSAKNLDLAYQNSSSYDFTYYDFKLPFWNLLGKKYILIRKNTMQGYLYGWLLISVSNYKDIYFFEYAIQKDKVF